MHADMITCNYNARTYLISFYKGKHPTLLTSLVLQSPHSVRDQGHFHLPSRIPQSTPQSLHPSLWTLITSSFTLKLL
jgi:hypothetical protein